MSRTGYTRLVPDHLRPGQRVRYTGKAARDKGIYYGDHPEPGNEGAVVITGQGGDWIIAWDSGTTSVQSEEELEILAPVLGDMTDPTGRSAQPPRPATFEVDVSGEASPVDQPDQSN
jgi:hypothetical protein